MFISIEGTDASGKSSLVAEIAKQLKNEYPGFRINQFHKGKPDELTRQWALNEYAVSIEKINWFDELAVADRWHWGEVTYAPLKRPETCVDEFGLLGVSGWRWVELFMASRGISQFWLYQPLDVITRRLESRGDDFVASCDLDQILNLYGQAALSALDVTKLAPNDLISDIEDLASSVILAAKRKTESVSILKDFPKYIGSTSPKVLLIGNRSEDPSKTILPFMPINNNSGEFLLSALPEALWRSVGIINAEDIYGLNLLKLIEVLGKPKIVALGRLAERELRVSGVYEDMYTVLPHPQYVKRFHWQDQKEYGEAIQSFASITPKGYEHWVLQ